MSILSQVQAVVSNLEPHTIALLCLLFVGPALFLQLVSAFFGFSAGSMILNYLGLGWLWADGESRSERKAGGRKGRGIRRRADLGHESSGSSGELCLGEAAPVIWRANHWLHKCRKAAILD